MPDYSPTSSSYETAPTSPSETLYNTENRIRFATRGMSNTTTDEIVALDPRNVQHWKRYVAVASALAEVTTNKLEARLRKTILELDQEVAHLHYDLDAILCLRKEDLKRAQRRHNQTGFVLGVLTGILLFLVLKHRSKKVFELLDIE
ncbi:hypothetical protein H9Q69_004669 [Fusarium xylarioides]|nr:hypothetical protein H9Q69_004669 [Fusarium xylarioides]KAG5813778.1 hypothetical protein H9Q71_003557 [Fusarium xylarioides]KAG5827752.1 hypothetical protein H9Q74_002188 [Fusarium xylarioides]